MREIRVDREKLRARVQENRDAHRGIYEKAMDDYTAEAVAFFEKQLTRAKEGKRFQTHFPERMPDDHTDDYDAVLDMIDMAEDDEFVLSADLFRKYVRDEWGWKHDFASNKFSASYMQDER